MDSILFVLLLMILVYVGFSNVLLIRRYKQNKKYIDCYSEALNDVETAYNHLNEFIEKEKTQEFKNKAKVIKLYYELKKDIDYKNTLDDIDLKAIFLKNNKLDKNQINLNSDTFVFMILVIGQAHSKNNDEVIDTLINKLNEIDGLEQHLEYQEIIAFADAMQNKNDNGNAIMNSLLDGTYTDYVYEKNMIGLYKRIAAATLVYNKQTIDEYYANDLYEFARPAIGRCILETMSLYDAYKPVEEEIKEDTTEENKE